MDLRDIYFLAQTIEIFKGLSEGLEEEISKPNLERILSAFFPNMKLQYNDKNKLQYKEAIEPLLEMLDDCIETLKNLSISKETQNELNYIKALFVKLFSKEYTSNEAFEKEFIVIISELSESALKFEDRILIELNKIPFIIPFLNGDLAPKKLLEGAQGLFDNPELWYKLQDTEKSDLEEFVRCYLNQAWTAAGIMAMRVIESAIRQYYKNITGIDKKEPWGALLNDLIKNHETAINKKLVNELNFIREHIRNPLAHPEDRYLSYEEADIVFIHTKKILNQIYL